MGGVRHVVVFRWIDGISDDHVERVTAALSALPGSIPEIRHYTFGPDLGLNVDGFDFAVVGDFDSVDDYLVYRDHPEHRRVITELFAPVLAERAAVQMALDPR